MRTRRGPELHLFVCANRREGSPLGPGCGDRGDELYDALKREVSRRGDVARVWITKTHCLGICPREGATVARYPSRAAEPTPRGPGDPSGEILSEATPRDAATLLETSPPPTRRSRPDEDVGNPIEDEIDAMEELQRKKVLDLARRLKPGLTLEDVQNPHDFPELDDPDWHYADGVLAGIASVKSALRALRTRRG